MPLMSSEDVQNMLKFACTLSSGCNHSGWGEVWARVRHMHSSGTAHHAQARACLSMGPFIFDIVRKAFGLVWREGGAVEPSRILFDELALSLQSTQGLILWATLRAQWSLRCEARY